MWKHVKTKGIIPNAFILFCENKQHNAVLKFLSLKNMIMVEIAFI